MPRPSTNDAEDDRSAADTWPWRCLGCGETIFHDVEFCRDCTSAGFYDDTGRRFDSPEGFLDWMRSEPLPSFSVKVTTITAVELALTTLWLQFLLGGSIDLTQFGPFVG